MSQYEQFQVQSKRRSHASQVLFVFDLSEEASREDAAVTAVDGPESEPREGTGGRKGIFDEFEVRLTGISGRPKVVGLGGGGLSGGLREDGLVIL